MRQAAAHGRATDVARKLLAEGLGTALLLAVVVGSGIMGERLAGGNVAIALLANTLATVAGLYVLIEVFGPVSGAHFNPAVSVVMAARGALPPALLLGYVAVQLPAAMLGAWLAHAMFDMPILQWSSTVRTGPALWLAEAVATFGLVLVILRAPAPRVAAMVATYIGAAYWFTASTSFANPAAAFGRMFSDSFAGIAPSSVAAFVLAQLAGAGLALATDRLLSGVPASAPQQPMGSTAVDELMSPTRTLRQPAAQGAIDAPRSASSARSTDRWQRDASSQ